jgi:uncharacterized protein involved in outer membrane biogenesis
MKKVGIIVLIIVAVLGGLVLGRNFIIKSAVSRGVQLLTGLKLKIDRMHIGIFAPVIDVDGLRLFNPKGFVDPSMIDMPRMYVDYDLGAFLRKETHLRQVKLNLKEFMVIKNEKGELNINALKTVKPEKKEPVPVKEKKKVEFRIDELDLKIGKVIYKDYSRGSPPKVSEFNINIDQRFKNITDAKALVNLIVVKALVNTTIASITGFDLQGLSQSAYQTLGKGAGFAVETTQKAADVVVETGKEVGEAVGEAVEGVGETIKKILPFGKE